MSEHNWIVRKFPTASARQRPWVVEDVPDVNGKFVGQIIAQPTTNPNWEEIAMLIAAAPDLLDSLKEMVADLLSHATLGLNDREVAMLRKADAALKKAVGE